VSGKTIEIGPMHRRVAANILYWRTRRRMSLVDLSEAIGSAGRHIPPNALTRIATGERRIDVDDLAALADALGTSADELLTRKIESSTLRAEAARLLEEADSIDNAP
jgi:transcriptional regulator with XRE-family HTH domain